MGQLQSLITEKILKLKKYNFRRTDLPMENGETFGKNLLFVCDQRG